MNDKIRLYLTVHDILEDERVNDLIADVENYSGHEARVMLLIKRIVEVSNSHIWGTLIMLQQESENRDENG